MKNRFVDPKPTLSASSIYFRYLEFSKQMRYLGKITTTRRARKRV